MWAGAYGVERRTGDEATSGMRALVLDYGFEAGAEAEFVALLNETPGIDNEIQTEFEGQGVVGVNDTPEDAQDLGAIGGGEADTALTVNGWLGGDPDADAEAAPPVLPGPDRDFYKFTTESSGDYTFDIDFGSKEETDGFASGGRIDAVDTFLSLFDMDGNLIATSDSDPGPEGDGDPSIAATLDGGRPSGKEHAHSHAFHTFPQDFASFSIELSRH